MNERLATTSDLGVETAGWESHEMPGEAANPLAPHRVPLVSHRAASNLRFLKRLFHLLVGKTLVVVGSHFFLGNLHAGKESDVCADFVSRGTEGSKSSHTIGVHLLSSG